MSTFSNIGPKKKTAGLRRRPTAEERRARNEKARTRSTAEIGAAWQHQFKRGVVPIPAEELVKLRQDKDRLEWILPIVAWVSDRQRGL